MDECLALVDGGWLVVEPFDGGAEVAGLAAVPASAEVVIVADVAKVAESPLVARAIDQLLLKDADLAARWQKLQTDCKLDAKKLKHVVLAIGPKAGDAPGTGPVLMVATGQLVETELAECGDVIADVKKALRPKLEATRAACNDLN